MLVQSICAMSKAIRVLVLTKYGSLGASSRLRFLQYLPWLQRLDISVTALPLLSSEQLQSSYNNGTYKLLPLMKSYVSRCYVLLQRRHFDVVWIEKEALPWCPLWLELALLRSTPYVLDYDDAVFHNYDRHSNAWVRHLFGSRLDGLMASAAVVVAGNQYLAQRARDAEAHRIEILPTVIDLVRYPHGLEAAVFNRVIHDPLRIIWVGSPSTVRYLQLLQEPLQTLAKSQPFILRVIGGKIEDLFGLPVETIPWAEHTEVENIRACDVGVMPLIDDPFERGKCGYKLIQYMACGLPVVASPVGVNCQIVEHGVNGFLAETPEEWGQALGTLLADADLRQRMGMAGRLKVEQQYSLQVTAPKLIELLRAASQVSAMGA
jgi:glycosyltransferase involved in cell wall biosynthesis